MTASRSDLDRTLCCCTLHMSACDRRLFQALLHGRTHAVWRWVALRPAVTTGVAVQPQQPEQGAPPPSAAPVLIMTRVESALERFNGVFDPNLYPRVSACLLTLGHLLTVHYGQSKRLMHTQPVRSRETTRPLVSVQVPVIVPHLRPSRSTVRHEASCDATACGCSCGCWGRWRVGQQGRMSCLPRACAALA